MRQGRIDDSSRHKRLRLLMHLCNILWPKVYSVIDRQCPIKLLSFFDYDFEQFFKNKQGPL